MIEYREAKAGDVLAIGALHARNFAVNNRQEAADKLSEEIAALWENRLCRRKEHQLILVAVEGELLLGFICVYGSEHPAWGSLIDNLHVVTSARRAGIGSSLFLRGAEWLGHHHGHRAVYLEVLESNTIARAFYERYGGELNGAYEARTHGSITVSNCRYTWPSPRGILADD